MNRAIRCLPAMPPPPCDSAQGNAPDTSAMRTELSRHLALLELRAANETDPQTRAEWEDQAIAVRALLAIA